MNNIKKSKNLILAIWRKSFSFVQAKANQSDSERVAAVVAVFTALILLLIFVGPLIIAGILVLSIVVFVGVRAMADQLDMDLNDE